MRPSAGESRRQGWADRWSERAAAAVLAALPFALQYRYLFGNAILHSLDNAQLQLPRIFILQEALRESRSIPFWQSLLYGGSPFLANPENPVLYAPILALLLFLPPVLAMNVAILGHFAWAAAGAFYLTLRVLQQAGMARARAVGGAFFAGVVLSCCYYTRIEYFNFVTYGFAHAWIPWIWLASLELLHGPRPLRSAGWLGLALGMQMATGGLYVMAYTALSLPILFVACGAFGGREPLRRTLLFAPIAAAITLGFALAKYVPFKEWVVHTSRSEALPLSYAFVEGLGGRFGQFEWSAVGARLALYTNHYVPMLPAIAGLALARRGSAVRAMILIAAAGAAIAAGPLYVLLHDYVPPFDRMRTALRGWTLVAPALACVAGAGVAFLTSALMRIIRSNRGGAIVGVLCSCACLPMLMESGRFSNIINEPDSLEAVLARYPHWTAAAKLAQNLQCRAANVDIRQSERNEQFIASALGVEVIRGELGDAWPVELFNFVYGPPADEHAAPLAAASAPDSEPAAPRDPRSPALIARRMSILSVGLFITMKPDAWLEALGANAEEAARIPADVRATFPERIDGTGLVRNRGARARAFFPPHVVAVMHDDVRRTCARSLVELPGLDPRLVGIISVEPDAPLSSEELRAVSLVVNAVPGPDLDRAEPPAPEVAESLRAAGTPLLQVHARLRPDERKSIIDAVGALERRDAADASFERRSSDAATMRFDPSSRGRFIVASESWAIYGGWRPTVGDLKVSPVVRRADEVAAAVFIPAGAHRLDVRYSPDSKPKLFWLLCATFAAVMICIALGGKLGAEPDGLESSK